MRGISLIVLLRLPLVIAVKTERPPLSQRLPGTSSSGYLARSNTCNSNILSGTLFGDRSTASVTSRFLTLFGQDTLFQTVVLLLTQRRKKLYLTTLLEIWYYCTTTFNVDLYLYFCTEA